MAQTIVVPNSIPLPLHLVLKSSIHSLAFPGLVAVLLGFWNTEHDETWKGDNGTGQCHCMEVLHLLHSIGTTQLCVLACLGTAKWVLPNYENFTRYGKNQFKKIQIFKAV